MRIQELFTEFAGKLIATFRGSDMIGKLVLLLAVPALFCCGCLTFASLASALFNPDPGEPTVDVAAVTQAFERSVSVALEATLAALPTNTDIPTAVPTETDTATTLPTYTATTLPTGTAVPTRTPWLPTSTPPLPTATRPLPTATLLPTNTIIPTATSLPTSTPLPPTPEGEYATVTRIIDGDSIEVNLNGQTVQVRYIGINAPEYNDPCGSEATQANANLIYGKTLRLVKDVSETDPFGRLLRYVYVGNLFVNAELVRQGWAIPVEYPPDTAQASYLEVQFASAPKRTCQVAAATEPPPPPSEPPSPSEPPPASSPPSDPGVPAGVPSYCTCTGPDLDCKDFNTHNEAQACYNYCVVQGFGNVYRLDGNDNDGLACESLP